MKSSLLVLSMLLTSAVLFPVNLSYSQGTKPVAKPAKTPLPEITIMLGDDDGPAPSGLSKPVPRASGASSSSSMDPKSLTPGGREIYKEIMNGMKAKNPALADETSSLSETTRKAAVILARKNDELNRAEKALQAAADQINNAKGLNADFTATSQIENRILMFDELGAKSTLLGQVIVDAFGSIEKELGQAGVQGNQIKAMTDTLRPNLSAKMNRAKAGAAVASTGQEALKLLLDQWGKWEYKEGAGVVAKPEFDPDKKNRYNELINTYNQQRAEMDKTGQ